MDIKIARFQNVYGPGGTWTGSREKAPAASYCLKDELPGFCITLTLKSDCASGRRIISRNKYDFHFKKDVQDIYIYSLVCNGGQFQMTDSMDFQHQIKLN